MDPIFVVIVSLALLSILALLWIRTGRRKAEIKDLKRAVRRLKGSKNASVQKTELKKIRNKSNEAFQELGGRISYLRKQVKRLERRITELEDSEGHGSEKSESGKDSSTNSIGFKEPDSGFGSDHEREDRRDYQSQKTGQKNTPKQLKADYNRILSDDLSRREFQSRYEPVPLGIKNEKQRLDREEAPVLLQKAEKGQYLSIETDSGHLIVPQPEITLEDPTRRLAGYDEVFQCEQPPHNHPYVVQHLHRIARFAQGPDGTYTLEVPGRIDLQRYD